MRVSILCLNNPLGAWDEDSLKVGIGGSETAVIQLSKYLGERGHTISVYNDKIEGKERVFGNVTYKKYSGSVDKSDVVIAWRNPDTLLKVQDQKCRKVLWLHDLIPEGEVIQYIHLCDLIWVPSLFHRGFYKSIPDDKFIIQPSGIEIIKSGKTKRNNLLCYTSDYDRGLDILLDIWPKYIMAYPDDELVVAYGTQTQESIAKRADEARGDDMGTRSWAYRWQLLQKRMNMHGIKHVGKLSKPELADLYEEASIMAYPSIFPETQCLVVLDAQAHGCIPVTTSLGALQETNDGGYMIPPDADPTSNNYLQLLLNARSSITDGRRVAAKEIARSYEWKNLIEEIEKRILGLHVHARTNKQDRI